MKACETSKQEASPPPGTSSIWSACAEQCGRMWAKITHLLYTAAILVSLSLTASHMFTSLWPGGGRYFEQICHTWFHSKGSPWTGWMRQRSSLWKCWSLHIRGWKNWMKLIREHLLPKPMLFFNFCVCPFILHFFRSGSSLVGELTATLPNASYFFEPLHSFPARVR